MSDIFDSMGNEYIEQPGKAGLLDIFDNDHESPETPSTDVQPAVDRARPDAVRGRYVLPNPVSGKSKSWQRVTTFVGLSADTYHLELWKQRMIVKGLAGMVAQDYSKAHVASALDVKADKERLNHIVALAKEAAGANKAADRGTELHKSSEDADYAGSWQDPYSILKVTPADRPQIHLYLDTLRAYGLEVAYLDDGTPAIERVTASQAYEVAGKLDRVLLEADGNYVVADLKTKDTLDFGAAEIAAQLACYEDGINNTGIWDGARYNRSIKVRNDYGLVIHLPQNGSTCTVHKFDMSSGREIARVCLEVRDSRKIKGQHIMSDYAVPVARTAEENDDYWLEAMNAAHTVQGLLSVRDRARAIGQWNERLAGQARVIAKSL